MGATRKRILYYSHTRQVSGAERVLLTMLQVLDTTRFEAAVACPDSGPGALDQLVHRAGVEVLPTPSVQARFTSNPIKLLGYLVSFAKAILAVRKTIFAARPDLVHANSVRAGIVATLATTGSQLRILWHVQDDLPDHPLSTAIRILARLSTRTGFVAVSNGTARAFEGAFRFSTRMHVLHNGIDGDRFPRKTSADRHSSFRASLGILPDGLLFVSVGMISPRKGLLELVEAFALALDRLPENTHLALVGAALFNRDDLYLEALRDRVASLALEHRIHLPGPSSDVSAVLRTADLLILNAQVEPFGLVLIEAAASGTAILATEVAGPTDILFSEVIPYGFSTPPPRFTNPQALAERLVTIGQDPEARREVAERARVMVLRRFSQEAFLVRLNALYD